MIELKAKWHIRDRSDARVLRKTFVKHQFVLDIVKDKIEEFHTHSGEVRFSTTYDGLDSTGAVEIPHQKARIPNGTRAWFGFTNVNSGRQRTRMYGGLTGDGWSIVMSEYDFPRKNEREIMEVVEDTIARFSFNLDSYVPRLEFLRERALKADDSAMILIEAARSDVIAWRGLAKMEETYRKHESRFDFLRRFCMACWLRPPIASFPPTNQLAQLYGMYRRVADVP